MAEFKTIASLPSRDMIHDAHDLIAKALFLRYVKDHSAVLTFDRDELDAASDAEFEIDVDDLIQQNALTFRKTGD